MTSLTDLHRTIQHVTERLGPAVIRVGRGSGIVVADGHVLTNAHNLHDEPRVVLADGRRQDAAVLAVDIAGDLAVLTTNTEGIDPAELSSTAPSLGTPIVALARPRHRGLVATFGTISAVDARFRGPRGEIIRDAFEHAARLPHGASGGPVALADGSVIGIDTHRRRDGFYAAIAATSAEPTITALLAGKEPSRLRLGITVAPPRAARQLRAAVGLPEVDGVLVRDVDPDGVAAAAGILRGDLITRVGDVPIARPDDIQPALTGGTTITLLRGADEHTVAVAFGDS